MSGHRLDWRPAPLAHRLATVALLAGLAALLLSRPDLLLLAAPPVGVLAAGRAARRPRNLTVRVTDHPRRCFEGEPVEITVTARADGPLDEIAITLDHSSVFTAEITARDRSAASAEVAVVLSAGCWGRHPLPRVVLDCRSRYRTGQARVVLALGEIKVFPAGPPARPRITTLDLPRRLGEHVARTAGSGVEFAGIRPYLPGDRVRDLNWRASGARGRPHVTTRADQRQAEIVLAVDAFTDLGERGRGTLDRGMRGAAAMATAYLRAGDRVGIVAFGGVLRWLAPGQGGLHFHRLAEAVMDVRNPRGIASDIVRVPRSALPPGALVIVFSPLLDDRAVQTVQDLRRRGNPVIVIDTLDREPPAGERDAITELSLRLWRLDRRALLAGLADLGIPVVPWSPADSLDAAAGAFGHPVRGRHS